MIVDEAVRANWRFFMVVFWTTAYGKDCLLGAMSIDHVNKCIWAIRNNQAWPDGCNGFSNGQWLMIFETELTRRKRFASV